MKYSELVVTGRSAQESTPPIYIQELGPDPTYSQHAQW